MHQTEWKANAPDDLNVILASIIVKAHEGSAEDVQAEVEKAKADYNAEDSELVPWFESQIENLTYDDEEEAVEESAEVAEEAETAEEAAETSEEKSEEESEEEEPEESPDNP